MLRFAPSPTGDMHIGNLRVALFNYLQSKKTGEGLTIRIEDTDKARTIEGKDKEILDILNLFGIEYESVSYQSENFKRHQMFALQLIQSKIAFNCFCDEETLNRKQEEAKAAKKPFRYDDACLTLPDEVTLDHPKPFSVRIKRPLIAIDFTDRIQGKKHFEPEEIDSFIILNQEKMPTSNFACAVDDMLSDISLVIRGEDHIFNTPKQMAIRAALGYTKSIEYAHLPIILNDKGEKMSMRDNASSVKWLLTEGFLPEAISNYLCLLGNKTPKEIFTMQEAIEFFDLNALSESAAKFDIDKLRFINREHLKIMDDTELSRYVGFADADIGKAAKIYLEEASTTKELRAKIEAIFAEKKECGEYTEYVEQFKRLLQDAPHFKTFKEVQDYIIEKSGVKGENFLKSIRLLLTGAEHGPDLAELYPYIKNYLSEIIR